LPTRWKVSKPVRLALYLLECLIVLALAALVVMDSSWFQQFLEGQVIANLESLTGGRVEIGQFRFRPWLLQIRLEGLVIHGAEAVAETPLVSAREVEAGISPPQLLRRRLRLRHLDVDGLEMHFRTNSQGISNLPGPPEQTSQQRSLLSLMDLSIGRLTVSHSAFYWNDQRQPLEIDAKELAVLVSMSHGRYSGTLSSSAARIHSPSWSSPPINFNSRFELSRASLVFTSFAWQAPGTSGGAAFTILPRPTLEGSGSFHASTEIPALARILHAPELRGGTVQIEGLAVYQGGALSAQGRAQTHQLTIFTPAFPSLRLDATANYSLDGHKVNLTNLLVSVWGGTAVGTFQANLQDATPTFRLNTQIHKIRLENVLASTSTPPLLAAQLHPATLADGAIGATWSGRWQGLKADFDLALRAPEVPTPHMLPISGTARGTLEDGNGIIIHVADSELRTPHSTVNARGTLTQKSTSPTVGEPLALTISTDDFEESRPFFEALIASPSGIPLALASPAEFSGQLSGSSEAPYIRGRVTMGQFRYHGWAWDRLAAVVALNPGLMQITEGRVDHGKSSFELNGSAQLDHWRFTPTSELRFSAQAQHTSIEGLKAVINSDLPVRGSVTGRVDVEGTPSTLQGSGDLRIDAGAIADEPFDTLSARLQVARSIWKMQEIHLTKNHGQLSGDLVLEPGRQFASGQLVGADLRLADMHRLSMATSASLPKGGLAGSLSFEARGQGTPQDFHLQTSWRFRDLRLAGTTLGEFHGTLAGEGKQLVLKGENHTSGGDLQVSAKTTAEGNWPMEADGEYSSLRADPWIAALLQREFGAKVTLGGSFHAVGPLRTPEKIDFQSHIRDMAVDFPDIQWHNAQPVDLHFSGGRLAFSRFVVRGPSTELSVGGSVRLQGGVTLDVDADGAANATLLTIFDPRLQAAGRSTLRMHLAGTPDHPALSGALDIQDMSLGYNELPFRFSNLQGSISLEGERAVIRSLRGTSGGGTVKLSGFVTLVEGPRFEVRAELSQARMRYPPSFTSVFDGNLRLSGGVEQSQITGDLVVHQMVLNENINFITKLMGSSNPMPDQAVGVNSPVASKIRLNVRVTSAPPVQLQTPNFRLTGDIDLRLQGTVADPVQVGSIHFLSGESIFRGNRYTLVRGDINFTNPFRTQAYLDLEAATQVQSYDLTLDISGPFDRLKFSYRSDPPLANSDILSLLALGYVKQEGAYSTAAGNPSASIGASAILDEALSSQTTSRIQHLFGVSRIKIDPNVGIPGFGAGALVTVEQQVTHDLTLTYVTDTSYSQYRIIQFEWNISDKVSVLGIRDQNGVFGIEFRFRRRFK
jgi:translocation and assembly module TamB